MVSVPRQNCQSASNCGPSPAHLLDQVREARVQLERAAGEVDRVDARALSQQLDDARSCGMCHHLGTFRTGVDVAMVAGLIAQLADVNLQGPWHLVPQPAHAVVAQDSLEVRSRGTVELLHSHAFGALLLVCRLWAYSCPTTQLSGSQRVIRHPTFTPIDSQLCPRSATQTAMRK